eukprot:XP_014778582.1 PREDICTED: secretory carrier-associated membrane protein 1-like isoform X2 [Octopus bimaculoides]
MTPSEEAPPYSAVGAQKIDTSDLQRRQEELERKAAELQRKEQEMRNMQLQGKQNNWPPLPKWFPIGPCFYQDFSVDIPLEFQKTVKFAYYLWMLYVFVLFLNFLGSLANLVARSDGANTFGFSILWFLLFTPCSFVCWYRPLYKAFRSDSSFNFFIFFFVFFFQFCTCVIMSLGIPGFTVYTESTVVLELASRRPKQNLHRVSCAMKLSRLLLLMPLLVLLEVQHSSMVPIIATKPLTFSTNEGREKRTTDCPLPSSHHRPEKKKQSV